HDAERKGRDLIAFSRVNVVDGVVSACYPDVAFRLARRTIPWLRPVHEYPDCPSERTFLFLGGDIVHLRRRDEIAAKRALYESIMKGASRPAIVDLLLSPFPQYARWRPNGIG